MFQLVKDKDPTVVARYVTPIIALVLVALRLYRRTWRRQDTLVGAVLVVAFVVSVWQVRGSTFSIALAVIPLSAWIGKWREQAEATPTRSVSLKMVAVWLVSLNAVWAGAAAAATLAIDNRAKTNAGEASAADCEDAADFRALASQPDTTVLAISNLGAPIVAYSGHRVLAGPYHRNIAGNLLVLDAFMGTVADAKGTVDHHHIGLVALCAGSAENRLLVEAAPNGFLAQLLRGTVPAWLEPVAETRGKPLELYRVKQGA